MSVVQIEVSPRSRNERDWTTLESPSRKLPLSKTNLIDKNTLTRSDLKELVKKFKSLLPT